MKPKAKMGLAKAQISGTRELHAMLLPGMVLLFIFNIVPLGGLIIAFQDFDYLLGIEAFWQSEWLGWENFRRIFVSGSDGLRVISNTIRMASLKIIFGLLIPILFSILLNEVSRNGFKRTVQTVIYLPNFMSWVIFAGIIRQMLMAEGTINLWLQQSFGLESIPFLSSNDYFVSVMIVTDVWKSFGFGTVIYLAVLAGINPNLYEAAMIDGANRWQRIRFVTLPGMYLIIMLNAVLSLQNILNAGFEQILTLYSPAVYETGDILDTYIYRISLVNAFPDYSFSTALGLFKSMVSAILIVVSYKSLRRWTGYNIF